MSDQYWIQSGAAKAVVDSADERDRFVRLHGWSESAPPVDGDFVWMDHPDDGIANPGEVAWAAREYWQGIGWRPCPPPEPVSPTRDPALTDGVAVTAGAPPEGSVDAVREWVGDDPARAQAALKAEQERDTPRKTLVEALEHQTSAAPAAPTEGE